MYGERSVTTVDGNVESLDNIISGIDPSTGEFLAEIILENECHKTLETGLAYGCSAIYILSATKKVGGEIHHIAIDPYQIKGPNGRGWKGIGLDSIKSLGWEHVLTFVEDGSLPALTKFIENGLAVDFIFVDGDHRFDGAFIDFILGDKILNVGGIIVFDDMWMPSIRKVSRFIERNMSYEKLPAPKRLLKRSRVSAFRKLADDSRDWTHFVNF